MMALPHVTLFFQTTYSLLWLGISPTSLLSEFPFQWYRKCYIYATIGVDSGSGSAGHVPQ